MNEGCTSVSCRANLLGNITASTQQITIVFSVDPNCLQPTDIFFGLRDANGLSLSNGSFVDCFSILQQDQLEVTFGPIPSNTEDISFTLSQQSNETAVLTVLVITPILRNSMTSLVNQTTAALDVLHHQHGEAIHPALGKGVVWFTRLQYDMARNTVCIDILVP